MQIPYDNSSPGPYGQPTDSRGPSPYPPSPYQQQAPPHQPYGHSYGQPYGQFQPYAPPPQRTYENPSPYGQPGPHQSHYEPPRPSHSPYDQQPPYHPPGQQGAAADYMGHGQYDQPDQPYPPPGGSAQDDRGVMGALAGGAAGAFAGHKVNHGFLGALVGAFAGHKLQDALHDHNKHKKDDEKKHHQQPQQQQHQQQPQQHQQRYQGNFTASSTQVSLDGDYDLIASCARVDGSRRLSSVSLNRCLTNSDGHLRWSKEGNFGASARNVRLIDGGKVLEAELKNCSGHWVWDRILLDEKISNDDGNLVVL